MYTLKPFDEALCNFFRGEVEADECNVFSIWQSCPRSRWRKFLRIFLEGPWCRAEWFPVIFWTALFISMLGSCYSCFEFISLHFCFRRRVSMWRERKYYVLPYPLLRRCRLVGSVVMMNAWAMLWYALINVVPFYMMPWLKINVCILGFEIISFILEVIMGAAKLNLHGFFTFLLPFVNYLFVSCIHGVFTNAIANGTADNLRLFPKAFSA